MTLSFSVCLEIRLKAKRKDSILCQKIHSSAALLADILKSCIRHIEQGGTEQLEVAKAGEEGESFGPVSRLRLGLAVRMIGEDYPSALLVAMSCVALSRMLPSPASPSPEAVQQLLQSLLDGSGYCPDGRSSSPGLLSPQLQREIDLTQAAGLLLLRAVAALKLSGVWNMAPPIDGDQIKQVTPSASDD